MAGDPAEATSILGQLDEIVDGGNPGAIKNVGRALKLWLETNISDNSDDNVMFYNSYTLKDYLRYTEIPRVLVYRDRLGGTGREYIEDIINALVKAGGGEI
ncbi:hypothetical protein QBC39DRAFT_335720 [Podospora conica]|nr:hypothetical protein QBC39DRAFT_335720 [Schizothecium conicum]